MAHGAFASRMRPGSGELIGLWAPHCLPKCSLASHPVAEYGVHGPQRSKNTTLYIHNYATPCLGAHCDCPLLFVVAKNLSMTSTSRGRAMCMTADVRHWHAWGRQWQTARDSCERASSCSASSAQTGAGVKATSHVKRRHVPSSLDIHS